MQILCWNSKLGALVQTRAVRLSHVLALLRQGYTPAQIVRSITTPAI